MCIYIGLPTDDEGLFGLGSMLVVPGRTSGGVDGSFGGAQERRLRLTLAGGPFPWWQAWAYWGEEPVQWTLATTTVEQETHNRRLHHFLFRKRDVHVAATHCLTLKWSRGRGVRKDGELFLRALLVRDVSPHVSFIHSYKWYSMPPSFRLWLLGWFPYHLFKHTWEQVGKHTRNILLQPLLINIIISTHGKQPRLNRGNAHTSVLKLALDQNDANKIITTFPLIKQVSLQGRGEHFPQEWPNMLNMWLT